MVLRNTEPLTPQVRQDGLLISGALEDINGLIDQFGVLQQTVDGILLTQANSPAAPVGNLLWNGECAHSVWTWHSTFNPPVTAPEIAQNAEAAWFFSHNQPAEAKTFTSVNVDTGLETVTITAHGFTNGCAVDLLAEAGGTLPNPLAVLTTYFLIVLGPDTLQFATTIGNAEANPPVPINLTTTGTAAKTYTIQQQLISTDSRTSTTNNELKTIAHATFDPRYSKWDSANGQADMMGTTSVDIIMPANLVDATTPLARVSLIAARANSAIEIPTACLFGCGIWDNTSGQREFLTGDIGFEANLVGASGTTERRFRAFYQSDRGFSLLSDEVIILNGLADGAMSDLDFIAMSWLQQSGQLQVQIYEHYDPSGVNEYRLVATVSSSTSFIYEGAYLDVVSGYPTPSADVRTATFFTVTADMSDLAINVVSPQWDTVNFPIGVPNNYNKGNTTNRQWVRLWMTVAANLLIPNGVIGDGTTTLVLPDDYINTAAFSAGGYETGATSLYMGLEVDVLDQDDVVQATGVTITDVISDTEIEVSHSIPAALNYKLRIVGGGFHGIIIDKVHLGYQQNTSYVPNANDIRTLQPLSAPASSAQGTVGTGGSNGGIHTCIATGTPVKTDNGWIKVQNGKPGQLWSAAQLRPNLLIKLRQGFDKVRRLRTSNGVEIVCTDTEAFMCYSTDGKGTPLSRLRVGDPIITEIDGRIEKTTVSEIGPYLGSMTVYTPSLSDNNLFVAGQLRLTPWQRFVNWVTGRRVTSGGLLCHNSKIEPPLGD